MATRKPAKAGPTRPQPPEGLGEWREGKATLMLAPAPNLRDWVRATFIEEDGALFNEEHKHLRWANFECLWAAGSFTKQTRTVVGQTEEVAFRVSGFQRWRQEQQLEEWFGQVPDYLITIAADYWMQAGEAEACALVEHELYHIGQKQDAFGSPEFTKEGLPKLQIRGHDVEEFVGVVRRYGVGGGKLTELVKAANAKPEVGRLRLSQACGTCLLHAA
jgi:hypothetical protein